MAAKPVARIYTPAPLHPDFPDGFSARWFEFVRALSETFDLEVIAVRGIWHGRNLPDETFRPPLPLTSFRVMDAAPDGDLGSVIEACLRDPPADLAVFFLHFLAPLAFRLPTATACIFALEEDVVGMHEINMLANPATPPLARLARRLLVVPRRWRYRQLAARCAARGALVVISEAERSRFSAWTGAGRIHLIPNGLDPQAYAPRDTATDHDIGIFGNLGDPRNYVPTRRLISMAQQRDDTRHLRWLLVGKNPHPALQALAGGRVTVTGPVKDTRDYYPRTRVVLVPARIVAGSKSTLLKAWAMQRPVVATPEGAAGLPTQSGHNLVIANDDAGLLDAALRLLLDARSAATIAAAGRRTLVEECDLRVHAKTFYTICMKSQHVFNAH